MTTLRVWGTVLRSHLSGEGSRSLLGLRLCWPDHEVAPGAQVNRTGWAGPSPPWFTCRQTVRPRGKPASAACATHHPLQDLRPQPASSKRHPKVQARRGGPEGHRCLLSAGGSNRTPPPDLGSHVKCPGQHSGLAVSPRPAEGRSCATSVTQGHGWCQARREPLKEPSLGFQFWGFGWGGASHTEPGALPPAGCGLVAFPITVGGSPSPLCPQPRTHHPLPVNLSTRSAVQGRGEGG